MRANDAAPELILAGRPIDDGWWGQVFRYCGLPWDDNPAETWAFRYFDAIDSDPDSLTPADVVCAGALHSGLSRDDLAFFWDHRDELNNWLSRFPHDLTLREANGADIAALATLPTLFSGASLSLVSKVLHRKRPGLIPMIDREIIDRYRPLTGHRRSVDAWSPLLRHLGDDLRANRERTAEIRVVLNLLHGVSVSELRIVDIAIWMGGQR